MKIREVIKIADDLKPNAFDEELKLQWLKEIETQIFKEIILTHENPIEMTDFSDDQSELIAPRPYDNLYVSFLCAKIDLYNNEQDRYNNQAILFNGEYQAYANWYNRENMPLSKKEN